MQVLVVDLRKYKLKIFSVRIIFPYTKGLLKDSTLKVKLQVKRYRTFPLALDKACNMGFKDEVAGDKKGGWTDQGEYDLRNIVPGMKLFNGVEFKVINPAQNNNKSCMVFRGSQRPYFLKQVTVSAESKRFSNLYVLHALRHLDSSGRVNGISRHERSIDIQFIQHSFNFIAKHKSSWTSTYYPRSKKIAENSLDLLFKRLSCPYADI